MTETDSKSPHPTLDDVASHAGVSPSTASKALNNRKDVSEATRQRVLQACAELGYQRSTTPATPTTPHIAIVADNLASTYTMEILKGAAAEAMRHCVPLALSYTQLPDTYREHTLIPLSTPWIARVASEGYIGVITITTPLTPHLATHLSDAALSHVAIDPANTPPSGTASIGATNWNGGRDATQHLIELGHRRIAFIRGSENSVPSNERYEGYLSALRMNDLPFDPDLVIDAGFAYGDGVAAGRRLLDLPSSARPTAIFACNDSAALGVYEAARERALRIPEDLSVVGFDDTDSARWATPRLTTVHQPLFEMGARAVQTLLAMHGGEQSLSSTPIRLSTHLVTRDSTAKMPSEVA